MKSLWELPGALQERRKALGLNQKDMLMKIGMTQQQYQRIEKGGDTRLSTLLRILEGMDLEFMLIPKDQVKRVTNAMELPERAETGRDEEKDKSSSWSSVFKGMEDE
ncbi:helix-turn-helix domain-containing protein [Parendozoicomonas sp. Alg238-R29]|uniref:helix-turn-helix domain-containing protein n=1 Tax=Parendozoicomonas sp. Alg238-R29 TaxID=2993446 RepID=UPI00248EC3FF|nr:helix-turn-helix domain-containing protein [Parendozoicomonas sp. Alg238-R29]